MAIKIVPDVNKIRRKTNSFLDWLGDWGGLYHSLSKIEFLVSPLATYMLNSKLA